MLRILATSDLHGHLPPPDSYPECDVFVIGGDVCPQRDHSHPFQRSWLETNFSQWLEELPARRIIGIGGNHDFALERYEAVARSLPWTYLLDEAVEVEGVKFYGMPWVPNLGLWAFHLDDAGLDRKFDAVPEDTDILIVHGPPLGYCDKTVPKFGFCNAGAASALPTLRRVRPRAMICGHIHEGYGYDRYEDTTIMNVAHMTENYEPINRPALIQLDGDVLGHDLAKCRPPDEQAFWKAAY